jgi:anthranilate synthase component 1
MYSLSKEQFVDQATKGNLIPLYREIVADMETPVSAFVKLGGPNRRSFLLESVEGGEKWGRYTFLGVDPSIIYRYDKGSVTIIEGDSTRTYTPKGDPLDELRTLMARYTPVSIPGLPRFHGGAVGFLTYDAVRFFEKMPETVVDELQTPDALFYITDSIIVFDNVANTIKVTVNVHVDEGVDPADAYQSATDQIDELVATLRRPAPDATPEMGQLAEVNFTGNIDQATYESNVLSAKGYISAGDIFQVVLAQRLSTQITVHPFQVYRALRHVNPSPYMYYLNCGEHTVVGASPESLVRVEEGVVETRPIAGTRPRGMNDAEDKALSDDLMADEKERAEHVMLVDLGRNDIGRVSEGGSVVVNEFMNIEKYSHVIHIVSNVQGELKADVDAYDALRACFPAGTLSGAPKIRAMEIIEEFEKTRRGIYGGAVGYFSFSGNMDVAIAIRTLQIHNNIAYLGVGAGIVADSIPASEYQETINKGKALIQAVKLAENGLEPL